MITYNKIAPFDELFIYFVLRRSLCEQIKQEIKDSTRLYFTTTYLQILVVKERMKVGLSVLNHITILPSERIDDVYPIESRMRSCLINNR